MADQVQAAIGIPLLHIADPTAGRIRAAGRSRAGLLGTAFTMEQAFYKGRLADRFGLDVLVPGDQDRAVVHRVIYDELVQGRVERFKLEVSFSKVDFSEALNSSAAICCMGATLNTQNNTIRRFLGYTSTVGQTRKVLRKPVSRASKCASSAAHRSRADGS